MFYGRYEDLKYLKEKYLSNKAEFVVMYGRRRYEQKYYFLFSKSGFDEELINIQKWDKSVCLFNIDDIVSLSMESSMY